MLPTQFFINLTFKDFYAKRTLRQYKRQTKPDCRRQQGKDEQAGQQSRAQQKRFCKLCKDGKKASEEITSGMPAMIYFFLLSWLLRGMPKPKDKP